MNLLFMMKGVHLNKRVGHIDYIESAYRCDFTIPFPLIQTT